MSSRNKQGFGVVTVLAVLVFAGVILFVGLKVLNRSDDSGVKLSEAAKNYPHTFWVDDLEGGWAPTRKPPVCPDPVLAMSPVKISEVTDWGYPGQWRGGNYKPHGLFAFSRNNSSDIEVRLPFDASLVDVTKYKEVPANDPQYVMTFQHECGYMIRFDHLNALGPEFAEFESLPTQTGTQNVPRDVPYGFYKTGVVVATGGGLQKNVKGGGVDFGLYDLRQPNDISKNPKWAALHEAERSQAFYALCWLDYLPSEDKAQLMLIPPLYTDDRAASDYCDFAAGGNTLRYNDGNAVPDNGREYRARE